MATQPIPENCEIVTRKEAKALGLTRYFTGKPCKRGHVDYRYVVDCNCFECARQKVKRQYHSNPEYRTGMIERVLRKRAENPETIKEYMRDYHAENRDRLLLGYQNRWATKSQDAKWLEEQRAKERARYRDNPQVRLSSSRTRLAATGSHTANDIRQILQRQKHRCAYCRINIRAKYQVDHIIPLARGGTNWPSNLQCLCPGCNRKKWHKDPMDFARETGRLL